jgi:hypothetical protein
VLFLAKFDDSGNLLWECTYGEKRDDRDWRSCRTGHIYVSAHFGGPNSSDPTHLESRLLKFDSNGNLVWVRGWGGIGEPGVPGLDQSHGAATAVDGVYMVGETNNFFANDAYLVKFDVDGNLLWQRDWGVDGVQAPFTGLTAAYGVTSDAAGNTYFTGTTSESGHLENIILVKFSGAGDLLWSKVGGQILPIDSTNPGGTDAFTLWLQR